MMEEDDRTARRAAAEDILESSRALQNAEASIADMRQAAYETMSAEVPAERLPELSEFLEAFSDPNGPAARAYLDGIRLAFLEFCVDNCTLKEIEAFATFQHSERFQTMTPALAAAVRAPLRNYQLALVSEINSRFR